MNHSTPVPIVPAYSSITRNSNLPNHYSKSQCWHLRLECNGVGTKKSVVAEIFDTRHKMAVPSKLKLYASTLLLAFTEAYPMPHTLTPWLL